MLCLLLKALLVLHCKLALYYVQQSGAASQRSVQTSLPRACHGHGAVLLHVLNAWVSSRTRYKYRLCLGGILLTSVFLPTPPLKSSESLFLSIELWMTDSVSLGSKPDVFELSVGLQLSYLSSIIFRPTP